MYIDPNTSKWLILGGVVVLCGLAVLFILAVIAFLVYRNYAKQKKSKHRAGARGTAARPSNQAPQPNAPVKSVAGRANQLDLVSFDDAIEISLETIKSADLDQAVQYLGQELKQEDLNTIWVISDVLAELLVRENFSQDDANYMVKSFKESLRDLPAMEQLFNEFPSSDRELVQMGDQIDDLLLRYMEIRELSEGETFLAQNPILSTQFADMRITSLALRQFLDDNQTEYWEVKKEVAYSREKRSQAQAE